MALKDETHASNRLVSATDAAVVVSLGLAFLYALGLVYWESFLRHFGLSLRIVEVRLEEVLATTWMFVSIFPLSYGAIRVAMLQSSRTEGLQLPIYPIILLPTFLVASFIPILLDGFGWKKWAATAALVGIGSSLAVVFRKRTISLSRFGASMEQRAAWVMVVIGVSFLAYQGLGRVHAIEYSRARMGTLVSVDFKEPSRQLRDLVVIARRDSLLFAVDPVLWPKDGSVVVLQQPDIAQLSVKRSP